MRRAHDVPGAGQPEVLRFLPQDFGQAEIRDFHAALFVEQDVFRLDVAMDDALVVGELERGADLRNDFQRLARRKFARLLDLPQVRPVHIFHDEIMHGCGRDALLRVLAERQLGPAKVVNADDVRVAEFREGAGFAGEAAGEIQVAARPRRENFQRDETVERRLARLVNRAHAALADEFNDFELGKQLGEIGNRGRNERWRAGRHAAFGRDAAFQEAGRAKAFRHVRFQFRAALRAFAGDDFGGGCGGGG